jgi:3-isopropylmalate/(R)-2-methylmalate dehydratase large subunit
MEQGVGQTVAQKIVARAAGRDAVEAGDYVTVSPDYTCCQELSWQARKHMMQEIGVDRVARPDKVIMVVDHSTSAGMGSPYYLSHREMKDFAFRNGVENFFGAGAGLRHLVLTEQGFARPGLLVFSDEPNIASIGALGALNIAVSSEVVVTQITDENWMMVPRSARIVLEGTLPFGVMLRDLAQVMIRDFATSDALSQSCIEFSGPAIAGLSLDQRQGLLACAYHTGADTALMPVDDQALAYVEARAQGRPYHLLAPDADAHYVLERRYDLGALSPMVTVPPQLHGATRLEEIAGLRIDQAAIGSCAGSRLDDLRAAAAVLRGRKIDRTVTMYVTPGSREIYAQAAREGLLETFAAAGAAVLAPGCTTCWGYEGALSDNEVSISTHQMNYHGRNGSRSSRSYLASPYVVAASAVAGRVADPRPLLAEATQGAA